MEKKNSEEIILSQLKDPTLTKHVIIEGVGEGKLYGTIDAEKLFLRLLQSESITG
jgi:hypothetical protein